MRAHQFLEKGEAVHARHFDIWRDDIGREAEDFITGHVRVGGRAHHFKRRIVRQDLGKKLPHQGRVVDNQNLGFHGVLQLARSGARDTPSDRRRKGLVQPEKSLRIADE
jgi:hypothetical protein